jgi:hypothetical protein
MAGCRNDSTDGMTGAASSCAGHADGSSIISGSAHAAGGANNSGRACDGVSFSASREPPRRRVCYPGGGTDLLLTTCAALGSLDATRRLRSLFEGDCSRKQRTLAQGGSRRGADAIRRQRTCAGALYRWPAHGPGYVAKVFPHSGCYKGCALFGPGVPLGQAERGLSDENERWLICEIL